MNEKVENETGETEIVGGEGASQEVEVGAGTARTAMVGNTVRDMLVAAQVPKGVGMKMAEKSQRRRKRRRKRRTMGQTIPTQRLQKQTGCELLWD